jgi:hypothetical protein
MSDGQEFDKALISLVPTFLIAVGLARIDFLTAETEEFRRQ